ncbi:MAG: tetratricopeptide repeat-containing sensor histidine kinase, partial [Rufibacter sp.]
VSLSQTFYMRAIPNHIWLVLVLLLFPVKAWAQQYNYNFDSLRHVINTRPEDTAKVGAYLKYAEQFFYAGSDSAFYFLHKAKKLSTAYPGSFHHANTLKIEGDLYAIRGDFEKSVAIYKRAVPLAKQLKNHQLIFKLLGNIGAVYKSLGQLDSAMVTLQETERAFAGNVRTYKDSVLYAFFHFQLFDVYKVQGVEKEALAYGERAYELSSALKAERGIGYGLYILALKHAKENPKVAMEYAKQAMDLAVEKKIPELQVFIRSVQASILINTGQYAQAVEELLKDKDLKAGSIQAVIASRLARAYYHLGQLPQAAENYERALGLAESLNYRAEIADALETGILIYQARKEYQKAFGLLQRLTRVKEEIASDALKLEYQRMAVKFHASEKDRELAQNQLIIAQKDNRLKLQNLLTFLAGLIIALVALFTWFSYRQRQKLQQQRLAALEANREVQTLEAMIQGEEKERSRLAKDLHDGIGGLLSAVKMHFSTLRNDMPELRYTPAFSEGLSLLDEASAEVRKTAHNLLPDMLSRFGLEEALRIFCQKASAGQDLRIEYQSVGNITRYSPSFELAVYRMVQELVHNIMKHAHAPEAVVQLSSHGGILSISVEDHGQGFDQTLLHDGSGMGLSSISARVASLGGTFELDSTPGNGTSVYLEFDTCPVQLELAVLHGDH